jgi:hypothetical protein
MKNLNRLMNSEGKTYSIGLIPIRRGVPKRTPFYFITIIILMALLDKVPILPFFWFYHLDYVVGLCINYILIPIFCTAVLTTQKKGGKKPERYLISMWSYHRSAKRIRSYRESPSPSVYQYVTVFTFRNQPRKPYQEEEKQA